MRSKRISIGLLLVMATVAILVAVWDLPDELAEENPPALAPPFK